MPTLDDHLGRPITSTEDVWAAIEAIPPHTPERYEALGFTLMMYARAQWRMADRLRRAQQREDQRQVRCPGGGQTPKDGDSSRGVCPVCGGTFTVRLDGRLRKHVPSKA